MKDAIGATMSSAEQVKESLFDGAIGLQKQVSELILTGINTIPMSETNLMLNSMSGAMKVYLMALPKDINPADIELYVKR
jgi:hypothetical protein